MGVDFLTCARRGCNETFADCGDYRRCPNDRCYGYWCSDSCAYADGLVDNDVAEGCNLCLGLDVQDHELVDWLLGQVGLDRKEAVRLLKAKEDIGKACCERTHVDDLECHCKFAKTGGEHEAGCEKVLAFKGVL